MSNWDCFFATGGCTVCQGGACGIEHKKCGSPCGSNSECVSNTDGCTQCINFKCDKPINANLDAYCGRPCVNQLVCQAAHDGCTQCRNYFCQLPTPAQIECGSPCSSDSDCATADNDCTQCNGQYCVRPEFSEFHFTIINENVQIYYGSAGVASTQTPIYLSTGVVGGGGGATMSSGTVASTYTTDHKYATTVVAETTRVGPCLTSYDMIKKAIESGSKHVTICAGTVAFAAEIFVPLRDVVIDCSVVGDCNLDHEGGGRFFTFSGGGGTVTGIHFSKGEVSNENGGAILMFSDGNTVSECHFINNKASAGRGGAIYMIKGELIDNEYSGNMASQCVNAMANGMCSNS